MSELFERCADTVSPRLRSPSASAFAMPCQRVTLLAFAKRRSAAAAGTTSSGSAMLWR